MRTKTISRWRKTALATATAASLALPLSRPLLAQEAAQPAPATPENGQIPATNAPAPDDGTTQQYTIQKGDTLWDLSQKFLANPWYWPKIWSLNPTIENPHWIYPGQKLNIKGGTAGGPAQVEAPAGTAPGTEQASDQVNAGGTNPDAANPGAAGASSQLGVEGSPQEAAAATQVVTTSGRLAFKPPAILSVKTPGLVSPAELENAGTLDASFEEKGMISTLDTAYVRFKQDNAVRVGDRLTIFRPDGDLLNHKGEKLGTKTLTVGEAKVIGISDGVVVVQVTAEREEVERGDRVRPWSDDSRRLAPRPNTKALDGTILMNVEDSATLLGVGQQVYIDKGKSDGVEEGNTFSVIRRGDGLGATAIDGVSYTQGKEGDASARKFDPDETVGLLMVIDARDNVSTAVVVRSIRELEAGDRIQMRAATGG